MCNHKTTWKPNSSAQSDKDQFRTKCSISSAWTQTNELHRNQPLKGCKLQITTNLWEVVSCRAVPDPPRALPGGRQTPARLGWDVARASEANHRWSSNFLQSTSPLVFASSIWPPSSIPSPLINKFTGLRLQLLLVVFQIQLQFQLQFKFQFRFQLVQSCFQLRSHAVGVTKSKWSNGV